MLTSSDGPVRPNVFVWPARQLEDHITTVDMEALGDELEAASQELPPSERTVATRLRNQAIIIKAQQRVVNGMQDIVRDIRVCDVMWASGDVKLESDVTRERERVAVGGYDGVTYARVS